MFYQVNTKSTVERSLIVEADNHNEARAKAAAAMYTFWEDDMLFEDDVSLAEEDVTAVEIENCELYDEDEDDDDDSDDTDDFYDDAEYNYHIRKPLLAGSRYDDYDPPEYFSD